jgi:hypothetical protein
LALGTFSVKDAVAAVKTFVVEQVGSDLVELTKVCFGGDGVATRVDATNGLPIVPVSGSAVDLGSVPASSRSTDSNAVALATDAIMNNLTALTPKFAKANIAASTTDGALVALVAAKKLRVLSFRIHAAGTATNVTFTSKPAGAGTAISELFACGANGGRSEAFNPIGHFETAAGEGLSVTTGAGSTVGVGVTYIEV